MSLFFAFHFYLFGAISIAAAVVFVTRKSPVSAAMWLVVTMFSLAVLYVMLGAEFIGALQVLVYAGAIMVLFLFVVMLLNLGHPSELGDIRGLWPRLIASFAGLALLAEVMAIARQRVPDAFAFGPPPPANVMGTGGIIGSVAAPLFGDYLIAFEVTSLVLLVAIVGAVVIGKARR